MSKLLSISSIRDHFCNKQCCRKNCMVNFCKMPMDCIIGDVNYSEHSTDLEFFTNLVREARLQIPSRATSKERIRYIMKLFENKHYDGTGCYHTWTYQISTTLCPPFTVCRHAFSTVYGIEFATIDTCQRLIKHGHSIESRYQTFDDSTAVDAMNYFGLELNELPAVNQNLDLCPETAASLSLVAYLEKEFYFLGDQEVIVIFFLCLTYQGNTSQFNVIIYSFFFSRIVKKFIWVPEQRNIFMTNIKPTWKELVQGMQ